MNIPKEVVEAAAEAYRRATTSGLCGLNRACQLCDCGRDSFTQKDWEQDTGLEEQVAAHVLERVAPFIAAQAWEVGYDVGAQDEIENRDAWADGHPVTITQNPYREQES